MSIQILMPSVRSAPWWRKPFVVAYVWVLWFIPAFFDTIDPDLDERHQGPIQMLTATWVAFVILTLLIWHYTTAPIGMALSGDLFIHLLLGALYWAHVRYG